MAKNKYIESPEQYKQLWEAYKLSVKSKPKLKHTFVGKDGNSAYEERERPLTWDGFELRFEKGHPPNHKEVFQSLNTHVSLYLFDFAIFLCSLDVLESDCSFILYN